MPTEAEIAELEQEWRREGFSDEDIGARLRSLAEESEREADEDPPTPEPEPEPKPELEASEEDFPLCPVCGGVGRVPKQLQQAPNMQTCHVCHGLGEVRTGSLKAEAALTICTGCNGNGWEYVNQEVTPPIEQPAPWERRY